MFLKFINDLPLVLNSSHMLMYADDVKLFAHVSASMDCLDLQMDLDNLVSWCANNHLDLNCSKCKIMSFARKPIYSHNYFLGQQPLNRVEWFNDLGILLDVKLSFNQHIEVMISKAKSMLGFVKRWSKEFADPYITKRLYVALVRPILEYGSVIWNPHYAVYADKIESVQKQFLIFALRSLNWDSQIHLPSYESRLLLIQLPSLKARRLMLGNSFMAKLMTGGIDAQFLLGRLQINVPARRTRFYEFIRLPNASTNYEAFEPLKMLCRGFNTSYHNFNF